MLTSCSPRTAPGNDALSDLRHHRIILVRRLRSQNYRQIGQNPQAIFVYYRGFSGDMTGYYASKMRAVNYAVLP